MPDHTGRRRKQAAFPFGQIVVLVLAAAVVTVLVTLPPPDRADTPAGAAVVAPTWFRPPSVATASTLGDGTRYSPQLFLTPDTSIGLAPSRDGSQVRLMLRAGDQATELRRVAAARQPQFQAFTVDGDAVVWAESFAQAGRAAQTSLWRAQWRPASKPVRLTEVMGEPIFYGGQHDLVIHAGRIYWAAAKAGTGKTTIRSVDVSGGRVSSDELDGDFALSSWPWVVSVDGGRGRAVELINLDSGARARLATTAAQTAACSPQWCRLGVFDGDGLYELDLVRPDGTGRRRIAGDEATPSTVDVALLDRYVALLTDRGQDAAGVGLSVYDITTGQTRLIAADVANVQGNGALLWWSTDDDGGVQTWHALDLHTLD